MDKIKEYLNNLFVGLPETPAVLRAKAELLEMMEDKYEELINDGKSETEAFGTVISEFGNLEELADALGIKEQLNSSKSENSTALIVADEIKEEKQEEEPEEIWDEIKMNSFLEIMWTHAKMMATGVMLFIMIPGIVSIFDVMTENLNVIGILAGGLSSLLFVGLVTAGVLLCVQSGRVIKTFGYNKRSRIGLSVQAAEALKNQREAEENKLYYMLIAGVLLCVFSILPSTIFEPSNRVLSEIVSCSFLFFVAVGVYMFVVRGSILNRYKEFGKAKLYNESQTNEINASYFVESKPRKLSGAGLAVIIASAAIVVGVVIISLIVSLVSAIKSAGSFANNLMDSEISYSEEELTEIGAFGLDTIDKVVIEGDAVNIKVVDGKDNQFHVKSYGSLKNPRVLQQGSNLVIDTDDSGAVVGINIARDLDDLFGLIYVELPQDAKELDFEYKLDSGKIVMDNLTADKIIFDADAGVINLNSIVANEIVADVDAGALTLDECVIKKFKADVDATAIKARDTSFGKADIETDASAIDIETSEGYESYGFDVETDFAAVKIGNNSAIGDYKAKAKDSSNGEHFIRIKSNAASIRVR